MRQRNGRKRVQRNGNGVPDWGDGTDCLNCGGGTKGTTN